MKKTKRFFALLLSFLMILSITGCSAKEDKATSGDKSEGAGDRIVITYMNWGNDTEQKATQATIDAFNASQDRIFAKQIPVLYDEYVTKLNSLATANQLSTVLLSIVRRINIIIY